MLTFGFQAANFGGDIDYGGGKHSLPWQLKAGTAVDFALVQAHHLTLTAEAGCRFGLRKRGRGRAVSALNTGATELQPCGAATAWATAPPVNSVTAQSVRASAGNTSQPMRPVYSPERTLHCTKPGCSPYCSAGNVCFRGCIVYHHK